MITDNERYAAKLIIECMGSLDDKNSLGVLDKLNLANDYLERF